MNTFSSSSVSQSGSTGLRDYMVYVYQSMALALGITGLVAFVLYQAVLASPELGKFLFQSPFKFVVMFAPFALVLVLGFGIGSWPWSWS